jgi:short-subunit dehydrogenase
MGTLANRIVIVTGASSGIGRATARRLYLEGAAVVVAARRSDCLKELEHELRCLTKVRGTNEGRILPIRTDITVADDRRRLIYETLKAYGRIDVLVNNAGYGIRGPIELVPIETIRDNFETNVFSLIALSQLVISTMREQKSGHIVNVSSIAGLVAKPFSAIYGASKHAVEGISDGLRGELAPFGIYVSVIEPGYVSTEFNRVSDEASTAMSTDNPYSNYYESTTRGYKRFKRFAVQPDQVAQAIAQVLVHPRSRIVMPNYAKILVTLKRVLPASLFDRLMTALSTGL